MRNMPPGSYKSRKNSGAKFYTDQRYFYASALRRRLNGFALHFSNFSRCLPAAIAFLRSRDNNGACEYVPALRPHSPSPNSVVPFSASHTRGGCVSHSAAARKIATKNLRRCSTYPPRRRIIIPAQFRKSRILYFNERRDIARFIRARTGGAICTRRANYSAREKK